MRIVVAGAAFTALLACSNARPGDAPEKSRTDVATPTDLVTTLEADVGRAAVRFVLHVTNPGDQPVRLEFGSGQKYDFIVQTPDGAKVWQWSDDMMFTQALSEETIPAGGSRDYTESWQPGPHSGRLIAIGRVTARNRKIEQRAQFEISKR